MISTATGQPPFFLTLSCRWRAGRVAGCPCAAHVSERSKSPDDQAHVIRISLPGLSRWPDIDPPTWRTEIQTMLPDLRALPCPPGGVCRPCVEVHDNGCPVGQGVTVTAITGSHYLNFRGFTPRLQATTPDGAPITAGDIVRVRFDNRRDVDQVLYGQLGEWLIWYDSQTGQHRERFGLELDGVCFDPGFGNDAAPNSSKLFAFATGAQSPPMLPNGLVAGIGGTSGGSVSRADGRFTLVSRTPGVDYPGLDCGYLVAGTPAGLRENDFEDVMADDIFFNVLSLPHPRRVLTFGEARERAYRHLHRVPDPRTKLCVRGDHSAAGGGGPAAGRDPASCRFHDG